MLKICSKTQLFSVSAKKTLRFPLFQTKYEKRDESGRQLETVSRIGFLFQ